MIKYLLALICLGLLSCGDIQDDASLSSEDQTTIPYIPYIPSDPKPITDLPNIPDPGDISDVRFCFRELIIIGPNCWFIICHPPCTPSDPGCHDFYCEQR